MSVAASKLRLPTPAEALPGRAEPMVVAARHFVTGAPLQGPFPGLGLGLFALGCFWGAERSFWQTPGVVSTQVGYAGGLTPNPTYQEVCSGLTGHAEVVRVAYDPTRLDYAALLKIFWEAHDPTQGLRQGADVGTQYRSAVFAYDREQRTAAELSRQRYQAELLRAGLGQITTEILDAPSFYFAEDTHQQYLAKNPEGYCGHGGTGVACPIGLPPAGPHR